jgi:hypothetical protein
LFVGGHRCGGLDFGEDVGMGVGAGHGPFVEPLDEAAYGG